MSKQLFDPTTIMFLAGIILIAVLASYSSSKGAEAFKQSDSVSASNSAGGNMSESSNMNLNPSNKQVWSAASGGNSQNVVGSNGSSSDYASVQGMSGPTPDMPSCSQQPTTNPKDLLPAPGSNAAFLSASVFILGNA